ncbi:hypothetical protein BDZ91DRAFT_799277 [Kalaharituber pfeilii]|nr:hypothetical protein BDZ91DRAFT_799277 [Kalaharituber pfeilii]
MLENEDDLARILTEGSKTLAEAKGEVGYGASSIEQCAEEARKAYGEDGVWIDTEESGTHNRSWVYSAIFPFAAKDEFVARANNTEFGLAGYIFSRDAD